MGLLIIVLAIIVFIPLVFLRKGASNARNGIKNLRKEYTKLREEMKGIARAKISSHNEKTSVQRLLTHFSETYHTQNNQKTL